MPVKTASKPPIKPAKSKLNPRDWLLAALPSLEKAGWSNKIWPLAAKKLGCDAALAAVVFPSGIKDLVREFNAWADEVMLARISANRGFGYLKVRQKIAFSIRARLEALDGHESAVKSLLAWSVKPTHALTALHGLYDTVDAAWYAAGDTSTDYNFYTKRGLLAGVVTATTFFWLNDHDSDKQASWAFLDARIDDVMQVGQKIGQLKQAGTLAQKFMRYRQAN